MEKKAEGMRSIPLSVRGPRMALIHDRHLFVTSYNDSCLVRMPWPACDREDGRVSVHRPRGLVLCHGLLYLACYGNPKGRIVAIDPTTLQIRHSFDAFRPRGIGHWQGTILVTEVNRERVVAYSPRGRVVRTWVGFHEPRDLCVVGDSMLVADTGHHRIVRVHLPSSHVEEVVSVPRPNGVASDGHSLVVTQWNAGIVSLWDSCRHWRMTLTTPAMVSQTAASYLICDATTNRIHVLGTSALQ